MSKLSIIKDYLRLFRIGNLLFIILIQFLTLFCVIFPFVSDPQSIFTSDLTNGLSFSTAFVALAVATTLIAAAGNIINDVYDVETDGINRPDRQVVSRSVKSGTAVGIAGALGTLGSIIGFWLSIRLNFWMAGFIFPLCAFGLWRYAAQYKRTLVVGNLIVSLFCSLAILIVWLFAYLMLLRSNSGLIDMVNHAKTITLWISGYALFAFITTFIREVVKDCEDVNGDTYIGCQTLPVVYGFDTTKTILFWATFTLIIILAFVQWLLFKTIWSAMVYWGFLLQFLLLRFTSKMHVATEKSEFHQLSNRMKIIMLLGVLSMLIIPFIEHL